MKITVVGDLLLDQDIDSTIDRLCPDAPVPVVNVVSRSVRAGGAGLVATMLALDGHDVEFVTVFSQDERAALLRSELQGIELIAGSTRAPTPTKTRVHSGKQAVCRLDEGCDEPPLPSINTRMLEAINEADAIVVSDYGRRLTEHPAIRAVLQRRAESVPLVWDPHPRGALPVRSATLVTPNLSEAANLAGTVASPAHAAQAATDLRTRFGSSGVLVTLGERGAVLAHAGGTSMLPVRPVWSADPCGAGDRLAATSIAALAGGRNLEEAAVCGVEAAREYLASGGVTSLTSLTPAHAGESRHPNDLAFSIAESARAEGKPIVAAGGCFDLLHAGHVRLLEAARALGGCLIVCMNSDESVRRLKGPERPIMNEIDRREMLESLSCVDAVVVFDEDSPEETLRRLRPDHWVKGGDYDATALPETQVMSEWGGRTTIFPLYIGRSTTQMAAALASVGA